jgi:acetyltransferase-like isoleucine patch superfamily enzyme
MRIDWLLVRMLRGVIGGAGKLWRRLTAWPRRVFHYYYLIYHGVETGFGHVTLDGLPVIQKAKGSRIRLGPGTTLVSRCAGNPAGVNHPVVLATLTSGAVIDIEGPFGATGSSIVAATAVRIGAGSGLGANSHIFDTDFHAIGRDWQGEVKSKPVVLGRNVWVAASCHILKGVTVGDNAVIGAASVVTRDVEAFTVVAGNPARLIRRLE